MSNYRQIKHLSAMVERVLSEWVEARNSDAYLAMMVWTTYFPQAFIIHEGHVYVRARDIIGALPREDAVGRIRRKFQERGKYLPSKREVAIARKLNMDEWRVSLGYPTVESAGTEHPSWTPPSLQSEDELMQQQGERDDERMNQHFEGNLFGIAEPK